MGVRLCMCESVPVYDLWKGLISVILFIKRMHIDEVKNKSIITKTVFLYHI